MEDLKDVPRPKRRDNIPVVLSIDEIKRIFQKIGDEYMLIFKLLYGTGMRIGECIALRYGDLDFDKGTIMIKSGKGFKDRTTLLPEQLKEELIQQLQVVKEQFEKDTADGIGCVGLPNAIHRKYPYASTSLEWQWLFPGRTPCKDPRINVVGRYHLLPRRIQKTFKEALNGVF